MSLSTQGMVHQHQNSLLSQCVVAFDSPGWYEKEYNYIQDHMKLWGISYHWRRLAEQDDQALQVETTQSMSATHDDESVQEIVSFKGGQGSPPLALSVIMSRVRIIIPLPQVLLQGPQGFQLETMQSTGVTHGTLARQGVDSSSGGQYPAPCAGVTTARLRVWVRLLSNFLTVANNKQRTEWGERRYHGASTTRSGAFRPCWPLTHCAI